MLLKRKKPIKKSNKSSAAANGHNDSFSPSAAKDLFSGNVFVVYELVGICFIVFGFFVFITNQYPGSTGILGSIIVQKLFLFTIGKTIFILPMFCLLSGIACFINRSKLSAIIPSFILQLVCTSIWFELILTGPTPLSSITVAKGFLHGGGVIGSYCLYVFFLLFGSKGIPLVLLGLYLASFVACFQVSLKTVITTYSKRFASTIALLVNPTQDKDLTLSRRLVYFLFFKTKKSVHYQSGSAKALPIHDIPTTPVDASQIDKAPVSPLVLEKEPPVLDKPLNIHTPEVQKKPPSVKPPKPVPQTGNKSQYVFPPLSLLAKPSTKPKNQAIRLEKQKEYATIIEETLASFNVNATVVNVTAGPSVTRYEIKPGDGVKISKITALSKDISLKLATTDIRIEAPIPGKALVGIEVPNTDSEMITMQHIITKTDFYDSHSKLTCVVGLTITGEPILMDVAKMPHLLIAGATGSGKSVFVNSLILSILMRATPEEVKFLMIDPKKVELSLYEGIPHLVAPVVVDPHKAAATLKKWALSEMERRYVLFSKLGVKTIEGYNDMIEKDNPVIKDDRPKEDTVLPEHLQPKAEEGDDGAPDEPESFIQLEKLPYIVVIIDELADLMMVASQEVENTICRLAQMARATGIHLVIATQRPSVNVVTGLIKANVPSRASFYLQSQIDSRTILDEGGAEKLLGKGDMLYSPVGSFKPRRIQASFVSEKEVKDVVDHLREQGDPEYLEEIVDMKPLDDSKSKSASKGNEGEDALFNEAKELVSSTKYASTSYLQRKLRIGYNRAARLMDELEEKGVISQPSGDKKTREVLS